MITELIQELKEKNIQISFSKGKLKYSGPEENIDSELLLKLKNNKNKLLKHFWPKECYNLMPVNTEGDLTPLAFIHGGPANYPISNYLGENRPFYGYFYIGSEGEKIRYKRLEDFAAEYLKQLQNVLPEGPYYLGGMSLGGHLAYEMAINLQKQGKEVPLLFLVDAGLMDDLSTLPRQVFQTRMYEMAKRIYYRFYDMAWKFIFSFLTSFYDKIPKDKRNRYIRWTYKEYIKKYNPTEEFKGKIILLKANENDSKHKLMGWDKICKNIELIHFKGNHGSMYHDEESVDFIKDVIKKHIDEYENSNLINFNDRFISKQYAAKVNLG